MASRKKGKSKKALSKNKVSAGKSFTSKKTIKKKKPAQELSHKRRASDGENMPWGEWIPGVLSRNQVLTLINNGLLSRDIDEEWNVDHSSVDLTLSDECYLLPKGSIKPFGMGGYLHYIKAMGLAKPCLSIGVEENKKIFQLKQKSTYLIKLNEKIPLMKSSNFYGQATAKSTIGRMDVLARLVVDGVIPPEINADQK